MTITALPAAPQRSDAPATFIAKADAFVAALPDMVTELNAFAADLNNFATNGTSATSLTIGTGSKSLTADTGKSWQVGMIVRLAYTTTATNWMSGEVTAYNSSTGAMTVNVTATSGSGTYAAWSISAAANGGATLADVQAGAVTWLGSVAGTNTITASATPALAAYAAGQRFAFAAANSSTGAVTLNIDSLGAKDVTRDGTNALRDGDIAAGAIVHVIYDGTRFQMLNQRQRVRLGSPTGTGNTSVAVSCDSSALGSSTTAPYCVAVGKSAGAAITTGTSNTLIGAQAGESLTTQGSNTIVGAISGALATGTGNTVIGSGAFAAAATGSNNVIIGNQCVIGQAITGTNNVAIGYAASLAAVGDNHTFTLGNSSIAVLRCAQTSITALSDARDKTEIEDLDLGLAFVSTLQPRRFRWNSREGMARDGHLEAGFIAQELAAAQTAADAEYLGLVLFSNPDKLEASPGKLLPIIVQAIKDLAAENATLRARLAAAGIP